MRTDALVAILLLQGAIISVTRARSNNTISFSKHTVAGGNLLDGAVSVYATDVDGNGDVDALGGAAPVLTKSPGGRTTAARALPSTSSHTIAGDFDGAKSVYATDMDGDGDVDVLGAAYYADDITWWEQGPPQWAIFLPVVFRNAGPPSSPPVLNDISNPDGDDTYTVNWSSVSGATEYILEEDDNTSFTSPTTVYSGASTSRTITGRDIGTYYYRAQATNSFGSSPWSNVVSVQVTQSGVVPQPGHWSGGSVSFEVTSDSSTVHDFTAQVYVSGCGTYSLTWSDMAISDGQFSGGGVSGEFSTPTSASGSYSYFFEACNGWVLGFGSWLATW